MLELPEAVTVARQIQETVLGKTIAGVTAAYSPHKFAWYYGDPTEYDELLAGKTITLVQAVGGHVEIGASDTVILLSDGVGIRFHYPMDQRPMKHQLLIEFEDASAISGSVQMYGGLICFPRGTYDYSYYQVAQEKPSPLSSDFSENYFYTMISSPDVQKLSAKAFLATEQRIPGLGNGVLQDILYNAQIHPKKKIGTFTDQERDSLYKSIKDTLAEMTSQGGRDTERDLFGCTGGYKTKVSKNTVSTPCPRCGGSIQKEAYMGGSIYYCPGCQTL